jgi:hypothetical protein
MENNKIVLNESEFKSLVESCVRSAIEEGIFDRLKAAYSGARSGYKGQQMLDRGTNNFKQNWDRDDEASISNPFASKPENTAAMQAREAFQKYKEYQAQANKFLNLYNQLTRKYNLNKDGVGQRSSSEKVTKGSGVAPMKNNYRRSIPVPKKYE